MSPFKSSSGRNLGKLVEAFKSSNVGSGLDNVYRTAGKKFEAVFTGGYTKVDDTSGAFYFYIFTSPGSITLQNNGINSSITTKYAVIGGGASAPGYNSNGGAYTLGNQGNPSSAFGSTALGGGVGGAYNPGSAGADGGSGGGGGSPNNGGGAGEGFPSPTQQGHPGGTASGTYGGGGGGGAGEEGQNASGSPGTSGRGGDGIVLEVDKADGSSNGSLLPTSYGDTHPSQPGRWFAGGGGGGGGGGSSDIRGGHGGGGYGVNGGDPNYDTQILAFGHANTGGGGGGWDGPGGGGGGAGGGGAGGVVQGIKTWTATDYNQTYLINVGEGGAKTDCATTTTEGNQGGSGIVIIRFPK